VQRELVERAAAGDQEAFEGLVRLSANRLFAIAHRILRDHHLAEDAVQQTLVTIWDELPRLRDPERFDAWSYRLIARASIAAAKRERRGPGGGALVRLLPDDANVTDESFTLLLAISGDPGDGVDVPPGEIRIENDPKDPETIVLTWAGSVCDTSHDLVIGDARTLTLTRPACQGDALGGVGHVLRLSFDAPAPAAEFDATLVTTP
jgi:hypothetical protein